MTENVDVLLIGGGISLDEHRRRHAQRLKLGLKLMQIGRQVAKKKPILIIKGGSGGGAEATLSHTASLAGSHMRGSAGVFLRLVRCIAPAHT